MYDPTKPLWLNKEPEKKPNNKVTLCVGTPVHSEVSIHYTQCLLELQKECFKRGVNASFLLHKSSLVTQGRNLTVASFLDTDATHLLFLDSDISVDSKAIFRMIEADKAVICIPYPLKSVQWGKIYEKYQKGKIKKVEDLETSGYTFPVRIKDQTNIEVNKGITEITHAPAGCLLIKRAVFETLKEKHPDLKIKQKTVINGEYVDKTNYYNFFDCIHDKKTQTYMGEDYGFCKLWTDLGGKVYGLVDQYIMHAGEHQYIGRFIDEFERKED